MLLTEGGGVKAYKIKHNMVLFPFSKIEQSSNHGHLFIKDDLRIRRGDEGWSDSIEVTNTGRRGRKIKILLT